MQSLEKGQFFGETNRRITLNGLTITDTVYTHEKVDWHYHQSPYFTFILQGNVLETNRKETYHCSSGKLLFHNWDDAHYNIKPPGFTRGFHIELEPSWLDQLDVNTNDIQGSFAVKNPEVTFIFYKLFKESLCPNTVSQLAVDDLLLTAITNLNSQSNIHKRTAPAWVKPLRDFLHEEAPENISLSQLAELFGIHPVHLSRYFPRFFKCTLGEYIRKLKVEKSLVLLSTEEMSLAEIALEAGFTDQSHLNRCFKENVGTTPLVFRKHFLSRC